MMQMSQMRPIFAHPFNPLLSRAIHQTRMTGCVAHQAVPCASPPLRSDAGKGRLASPQTLVWTLPPAPVSPHASPPEPTWGCPRGSPDGNTHLSSQGTRETGCDSRVLEGLQQARGRSKGPGTERTDWGYALWGVQGGMPRASRSPFIRCSVTQSCLTLCDPTDCSLSLLKLMPIESVMPSNHLICRSLLLLPSVFPSIRVFSNEFLLANFKSKCRH